MSRVREQRDQAGRQQQETARAIIFLQLGIRNSVSSSDVGEAIKRLLDILVKNQDIEDIEQEASQTG